MYFVDPIYNLKFYLFMVPGLCHCNGFSLVVANGDYSLVGGEASHCGGFSCCGAQALGHAGSVVVGLSHSIAYGIFPDRGSNSCLLHWQVDSLPLSHQQSPILLIF